MLYQILNAKILTPLEETAGAVVVRDGRFAEISARPLDGVPSVDARGLYLAPGFIDLHVHGGGRCTPMSGRAQDVLAMCRAHALRGTTSILPTTLAAPKDMLLRAVSAIEEARRADAPFRILGAHMEGPCLNPAQAGAQAPGALTLPKDLNLDEFLDACPSVRMMGVAPELDGGMALGDRLAEKSIVASIAHSNATYDQVVEAAAHGYRDITHLYSACSGIVRVGGFRVPGVIEAGLNLDEYTVQVIADGRHLPIPLLQLIYRCRGAENIILITDGLEFAAADDLKEGEIYTQFNGVRALYEDGVMKLPDRTAFAGSAATMDRLVFHMRKAGVPMAEAVRMATLNPAMRIGETKLGRIAPGCAADFVLFDDDINVKLVATGGRALRDDWKILEDARA